MCSIIVITCQCLFSFSPEGDSSLASTLLGALSFLFVDVVGFRKSDFEQLIIILFFESVGDDDDLLNRAAGMRMTREASPEEGAAIRLF